MTQEQLARMNALWHKSKADGLDKVELAEQKLLRSLFMDGIRGSLRSQLDNIDMQNEDGSIENLGEKYGKKQNKKQEDHDD